MYTEVDGIYRNYQTAINRFANSQADVQAVETFISGMRDTISNGTSRFIATDKSQENLQYSAALNQVVKSLSQQYANLVEPVNGALREWVNSLQDQQTQSEQPTE
jgi:iron uptake system EfeUOB component EfeO/EfeM